MIAALIGVSSAATAQPVTQEGRTPEERAARIATEPSRDIGLQRTTVPPVLLRAVDEPYAMTDIRTCGQIAETLDELDRVLGPDFDARSTPRGNRAGRIAEAGGRAVVNSLIPFRGVVRELTGSAEADRRLQAAIDAGIARRGFLRGVARTRGCRF